MGTPRHGQGPISALCRAASVPAVAFLLLIMAPCPPGYSASPGIGTEGSLYSAVVVRKAHLGLGARSPYMLEDLYRSYGYRRLWTDGLVPKTTLIDLIEAVKRGRGHGLSPEDYNLRQLEDKLSELVLNKWRGHPGPASLANEVELLATDSFLTYGSDMLLGRARPENLNKELKENGISGELMAMLFDTISSGDLINSIEGLAPTDYEYTKLQGALERYRKIASSGVWPMVQGPLKKGEVSGKVRALRKRLMATGDLGPEASATSKKFDTDLVQAVIRFQKRHGLPPTGFVGRMTLQALNVPVWDRIETIKLNMERLRWMPVYTASSLIIVNLTDFSLRLIEDRRTAIEMRVIIGKEYHNTPDFTTRVTAIVLNPSWHVPYSIASDELLPRIQANPAILNDIGYSVYANANYNGKPLDHTKIDWNRYDKSNLPYWFKRKPGNGSPLGNIKFIMPNEYAIYLHDTPRGGLFRKSERALSHGCVRLERPVDLAAELLKDKGWSSKKILSRIDKGREEAIVLKDPVMVQMVYRTSWVDDTGRVHFRKDVYEHDSELAEQMRTGSARALENMAAADRPLAASAKRPLSPPRGR